MRMVELFQDEKLRTIYPYWQLPRSLREIAGSRQILTTAPRSHASRGRIVLLREKPRLNISVETLQPRCSGFREVKLKRLAHACRERSNNCVLSARTTT